MWGAGPPPHSRVRLRAPDDVKPEDQALVPDAAVAPIAAPPLQQALPHLDVGSPEYIEERLENLKRRPTWGNFLDRYVEAYSDDDDDEAEPEERRYYDRKARRRLAKRTKNPSGFLKSLTWSTLVLGLWPALLLLYPFLRHKGLGFWPMGCSSMGHLLLRSAANIFFLLFGLVLLYWAICRELPELDSEIVVTQLDARIAHLLGAGFTCQTAMLELEVPLVREFCTGVGVDTLFLATTVWLIAYSHRRWGRYALLSMAMAFFVDGPTRLFDATFPAPVINRIDPTYAMVDEEITIAVDGQNLKPGGSIAWVSYWGCLTTSDVAACEKQFSSVFSMGVVHVTFKSIDHFIPCYRDPPNPLKAQEYVCFSDVRVRVKDKRGIPGWSKIQPPTPSPSIEFVSIGVSSEASEVLIQSSKRPGLEGVSDDEDKEHEEKPQLVLVDAAATEDDDVDSVEGYLEVSDPVEYSTPDDVGTDHEEGDEIDAGDDSTSEGDLDTSATVKQPPSAENMGGLDDFAIDNELSRLPNDEDQPASNETQDALYAAAETEDQEQEFVPVGALTTIEASREEGNDGVQSETSDVVDSEVYTEEEAQQMTEDSTAVTHAQLVEVEIAAADPSALALVIDEVSSSKVSAHLEPKPLPTPDRLPSEESPNPRVDLKSPNKQPKESDSAQDQERGVNARGEKKHSTTANDADQVTPVLASVTYTNAEVGYSDEDAQVDAIEHTETCPQHLVNHLEKVQIDRAPVEESQRTSQGVVAMDDIKVEATLEQKPPAVNIAPVDESNARSGPGDVKDVLKPKPSERPEQGIQRDTRRVQEREHQSVSSIRVDRRGSQAQPPRPSRQPSSSR